MNLIINGEKTPLEVESLTIPELLTLKKVSMPDMVSVQLNGEFVDRSNFDTTRIADGDEVDFLYFMGGGSR